MEETKSLKIPSNAFRKWSKETFTTLLGLPLKDFDKYIRWGSGKNSLIQIPQISNFTELNFDQPKDSLGSIENSILVFQTDIISLTGWMLAGFEEHINNQPLRDKLERWEESNSILSTNGYCEKPFINEWINKMRNFLLSNKVPLEPLWPENKSMAIVVSHDIDTPYYSIPVWLKDIFKQTFRLNLVKLKYALKKLLSSSVINIKDGLKNKKGFKSLIHEELKLGIRSTILLHATQPNSSYKSFNDPFYSLEDLCVKESIELANKHGFDLGLHPSHNTAPFESRYKEQKLMVEKVTGNPITSIRHHYWNLSRTNASDALLSMAKAGFKTDTSISFYDRPNFRRSVAWPFIPFHPVKDFEIPIIEVPSTLMDRWIGNKGSKAIIEHINLIKKFNGVAVLDWHCNRFNNKRFRHQGNAILEVIEILKTQDDVWIVSLKELADWWKKRKNKLIN